MLVLVLVLLLIRLVLLLPASAPADTVRGALVVAPGGLGAGEEYRRTPPPAVCVWIPEVVHAFDC